LQNMNSETFKRSLHNDQPPSDTSIYLQALWQDAKGNWEEAHKLIQDIETPEAAWIHAYLHRKEGDIANADYWYRRAGKKRPGVPINQEWDDITNAFL
jgi:hypothetical protein